MTEHDRNMDWRKTTFDGSRREQLRRVQAMTVRQRLEAMDQLAVLSERMRAMRRQTDAASAASCIGVREQQVVYHAGEPINQIVLAGCAPTPLANYLKALGVLRLLSTHHPETRGFWRNDRFVLHTSLDKEGVLDFFLNDYEPTPIMAPWNGGSGFYYQERKSKEKDSVTGKKKKLGVFDQETAATKIVDAVIGSTSKRLEAYREVLGMAKAIVKKMGFVTAPDSGKQKEDFILSLRSLLPDISLQAMDAGVVISAEKAQYPPLLGTGWNDGNMDFTSNFMQRLLDVLGMTEDSVPDQSEDWLRSSLFSTGSPNLTKNNIGQFSPGQAGGPNASTSFEAEAAINPWDFVLMIEGSLMFAAAAVRRNADDPSAAFSYPFTVRAVGAGSGSLGEGDTANARGELWMPLWPNPASYAEVRSLMAEGRVALGRKPARDALDFVRAIHHLGGYRGVRSFQRFGLLMRSGRAYLATPLARVEVSDDPRPNLLDELDRHGWLDRFRQFARGDNVANRFLMLRRQLEDQLFDLSGREATPAEMQSLIVLLGEIQQATAVSRKAQENMRPVPHLSEHWVTAADDGTPEFRIAKALAGLRGVDDVALPLRAQQFPVHQKYDEWMTPETSEGVRICIGQKGRLMDTLRALLEHRLWLADKLKMRDKPFSGPAGATLDDVVAFLRDDRMDARIAALLPGLSLCAIPEDTDRTAGEGALPAAFGLMKLALTPGRILRSLGHLGADERLPIPAGMLAQLAAGNHDNRAVKIAWRRLRASNLTPFFADAIPKLGDIKPIRATAALLIPLRYGATGALARGLLEEPETEADSASIA
jgi:CRISPR-associated protein Csx17